MATRPRQDPKAFIGDPESDMMRRRQNQATCTCPWDAVSWKCHVHGQMRSDWRPDSEDSGVVWA